MNKLSWKHSAGGSMPAWARKKGEKLFRSILADAEATVDHVKHAEINLLPGRKVNVQVKFHGDCFPTFADISSPDQWEEWSE